MANELEKIETILISMFGREGASLLVDDLRIGMLSLHPESLRQKSEKN